MTVDREDFIAAYRLILGREPDGEQVIRDFMTARDRAHLRELFLGCQEFTDQFRPRPAHMTVGRHYEVHDLDIDLTATDEQLQLMFDRIGAAWKRFGETEPHWSVIVNADFLQENLAANIDRFYAGARGDILLSLNFLRRAGLPVRFDRVLDFGCGVGRLTLALAEHAREAVGIDISPPHLELAAERAKHQGVTNVRFEAIDSVRDIERFEGFDLITSFIVLQHNPPPVMAAIYRALLGALAPGGVAMVQMPTYLVGQRFAVSEYLANQQPSMEMNALPQKHIFEIIEAAGCRTLEVREDNAIGEIGISHIFVVQKILRLSDVTG